MQIDEPIEMLLPELPCYPFQFAFARIIISNYFAEVRVVYEQGGIFCLNKERDTSIRKHCPNTPDHRGGKDDVAD